MKNKILIAIGFLLLLIGAIGIVIPVWPTTPFVLGAAACFAGSPKLSGWLKRSRLFREYIERYENGTPITRATVVKSLVFLWGMLILSCVLTHRPWLWALLFFIGAGVTCHILCIAKGKSTVRKEKK